MDSTCSSASFAVLRWTLLAISLSDNVKKVYNGGTKKDISMIQSFQGMAQLYKVATSYLMVLADKNGVNVSRMKLVRKIWLLKDKLKKLIKTLAVLNTNTNNLRVGMLRKIIHWFDITNPSQPVMVIPIHKLSDIYHIFFILKCI